MTDDVVLEGDQDDSIEPAASLEPILDLVFDRCDVEGADWTRARDATA